MEYCKGGDLQRVMRGKRLSVESIQTIAFDVVSAVKAMREKKIFHRDIKPENILLTDDLESTDLVFKLADFGFAKYIDEDKFTDTMCGSPMYMAPEVLNFGMYGPEVDLWSIGIMLFELFYGYFPFEARKSKQLIDAMRNNPIVHMPDNGIIPPLAIDLISRLLVVPPADRISFGNLFSHPWLASRAITSARHCSNHGRSKSIVMQNPRLILTNENRFSLRLSAGSAFDSVIKELDSLFLATDNQEQGLKFAHALLCAFADGMTCIEARYACSLACVILLCGSSVSGLSESSLNELARFINSEAFVDPDLVGERQQRLFLSKALSIGIELCNKGIAEESRTNINEAAAFYTQAHTLLEGVCKKCDFIENLSTKCICLQSRIDDTLAL